MSFDAEELRARVALMRELGVTRWGDLVLGPAPSTEPALVTERRPDESEDQRAARVEALVREKRRKQYARELGLDASKLTDAMLEALP